MSSPENNREELRKRIQKTYSLEELRSLASDLAINFDNLSGDILSNKIVSLIDYTCRHDILGQLREKLKADRPREEWDDIHWEKICLTPFKSDSTIDPPYQGLNYFDVDDAERFFGRERLIDEITTRIDSGNLNFLAIVGASGSGKSSLVRAGLIPALTTQQSYGLPLKNESWLVHLIRPGTRPLNELATALVPTEKSTSIVLNMIDEYNYPRKLDHVLSDIFAGK